MARISAEKLGGTFEIDDQGRLLKRDRQTGEAEVLKPRVKPYDRDKKMWKGKPHRTPKEIIRLAEGRIFLTRDKQQLAGDDFEKAMRIA